MKTILFALALLPLLAFADADDIAKRDKPGKYGKHSDNDVIGTIAKPSEDQKLPEELQKIPSSKSKTPKEPKN